MNGKEMECSDKNMAENQAQREYYKEWFNLGLILHGELNYLEAVKQYIIEHFCYTKKVKLIKPTYAEENLLLVDELTWEKYKKSKGKATCISESEDFYFACVLRGEIKILEKIKGYINENESINLIKFVYSKRKLYIVLESQKKYYEELAIL